MKRFLLYSRECLKGRGSVSPAVYLTTIQSLIKFTKAVTKVEWCYQNSQAPPSRASSRLDDCSPDGREYDNQNPDHPHHQQHLYSQKSTFFRHWRKENWTNSSVVPPTHSFFVLSPLTAALKVEIDNDTEESRDYDQLKKCISKLRHCSDSRSGLNVKETSEGERNEGKTGDYHGGSGSRNLFFFFCFPISAFAASSFVSAHSHPHFLLPSRRVIACDAADAQNELKLEPGLRIEGLPDYTRADVKKHTIGGESGDVWVSYREGVYNITKFIKNHPGGEKRISLAAGGSLEPFWAMYAVHKNQQVYEMLEDMRIGNLRLTDEEREREERLKSGKKGGGDPSDPFAGDPTRHPALVVQSKKPFNAETPLSLLADNFVTPNDIFFVRNHLPVPIVEEKQKPMKKRSDGSGKEQVDRIDKDHDGCDDDESGIVYAGTDGDDFEIELTGEKGTVKFDKVCFTIGELRKNYKKHPVTSTIQCAGNRRIAFQSVKPVKGLNWSNGAIGTATWGGARLRDVLISHGLSDVPTAKKMNIHHVQFEGLDREPTGQCYGASIPIEKALHIDGDVLLAWEMNGEKLPPDHGFPLRVIVPGVVGARNVKWLKKIILSHEESQSFWQQHDYRVFSPSVDWDKVDWRKAPSIQEYPVQSGICDPLDGSTISCSLGDDSKDDGEGGDSDESFTVRGYAWSGGGRAIIRVEVTIDGGKTWHQAKLRCRDRRSDFRGDYNYVSSDKSSSSSKFEASDACREKTEEEKEDERRDLLVEKEEDESEDDDDLFEDADDWHRRRVDKAWAWVLWVAEIPLPKKLKGDEIEISCRAVDASYNTQPESVEPLWNLRGCLNNAWHRVQVNIVNSDLPHDGGIEENEHADAKKTAT